MGCCGLNRVCVIDISGLGMGFLGGFLDLRLYFFFEGIE